MRSCPPTKLASFHRHTSFIPLARTDANTFHWVILLSVPVGVMQLSIHANSECWLTCRAGRERKGRPSASKLPWFSQNKRSYPPMVTILDCATLQRDFQHPTKRCISKAEASQTPSRVHNTRRVPPTDNCAFKRRGHTTTHTMDCWNMMLRSGSMPHAIKDIAMSRMFSRRVSVVRGRERRKRCDT